MSGRFDTPRPPKSTIRETNQYISTHQDHKYLAYILRDIPNPYSLHVYHPDSSINCARSGYISRNEPETQIRQKRRTPWIGQQRNGCESLRSCHHLHVFIMMRHDDVVLTDSIHD